MVIDIFTDGSSLIDKGYYESASAIVVFINKELYMKAGKFHVNGTISLGELYAMKMAYKRLFKIIKDMDLNTDELVVNIYSDSAYVVNSLREYIKKWVKQGKDKTWMGFDKKKPIAWQEIFKDIYYKYMQKVDFTLKIFKISGHIGEKISYEAAKKKFMKTNNVMVDDDTFKYIVAGNITVDKAVEYVRLSRLYKYKEYSAGVMSKCNQSLVITTENKILVEKRKRIK